MSLTAGRSALAAPPPPARGWPRQRIAGHVLTGLWALAGLGLVAFLANSWDAELFRRYAPAYLSGLGTTLTLVAVSIVIGAVLSLPIGYGRMSRNPILSALKHWPGHAGPRDPVRGDT